MLIDGAIEGPIELDSLSLVYKAVASRSTE